MKFGICTLDEFAVGGRTVLCRIDINQPVNRATGTLRSVHRVEACVPTLRELSGRGARLVLLAHQGSDIEYANFYTTKPHAEVLTRLLGREVRFVEDVCGPTARQAIREMHDGEIILLDNVRFCAEEQTLFEMHLHLTHAQQAQTQVVAKLAPLADLYVCDAFAAAHRDQPSLCGFARRLPSAMGRLFEREYCELSRLMEAPEHPCVFVLGGAKIADAFAMMETVLRGGTADRVLTGGLVGQILLVSQGVEIGGGTMEFIRKSGCAQYIEAAAAIYARYGKSIVLPTDLAQIRHDGRDEASVGAIPGDFNALDIGSQTAQRYREYILEAKTIFANGPLGVFERAESELGTKVLFASLAQTRGYAVVGGGDSVTAAEKYGATGRLGYICTGGGALIRFLAGEELPVVKALRYAAAHGQPAAKKGGGPT